MKQLTGKIGAEAATVEEVTKNKEVIIVSIPQKNVQDLPKNLFKQLPDGVVVIETGKVESQNLTMRMHMHRFTRLISAVSKKIENSIYAIALYFVYYNFVKIHATLRVPPGMEAGLIKRIMRIEDIFRLGS